MSTGLACEVEVGIVGAGLAGLSCARGLAEGGVSFALVEAAERVGGRVATDLVDGYRLDRGFQVLLSSYPEVRRSLDLDALGARPFAPGALVRQGGRFWRVVDPWRSPAGALATLRAPFVGLADALRMARLRRHALRERGAGDVRSADQLLRGRGFSDRFLRSFLRPFFAGVTLDPDLRVSADFLLCLLRWFSTGDAVLPARGMQAIPDQLRASLPDASVHTGEPVTAVTPSSIELAGGARIRCRQVVLATDATTTARLLDRETTPAWLGTTTLYYAAERSPCARAILVLNGEGPGDGPVNHLCVLTEAQPAYAPAGKALVSVSVIGVPTASDLELEPAVRRQLAGWYGAQVRDWDLLRVDRIDRALPRMGSDSAASTPRAAGLLLCGDHVASPSIQGAMESGRRAAEILRRSPQSRSA